MSLDSLLFLALVLIAGMVLLVIIAAIAAFFAKDRLKTVCLVLFSLLFLVVGLCSFQVNYLYETTVCTSCEERIAVESKFCPECGADLREVPYE